MSTFDSTKKALPEILKEIIAGKIQLPDFQRGWVWDDEHVKSLLISIARSFPIGAVMLLETGGDVNFQVRPVENVDLQPLNTPAEKLILDGQQRLTTLTQVLMLDMPVKTYDEKRNPIKRYYYINIKMALENGNLDEAFISVEEDRKQKRNFGRDVFLDLSTRKLECEQLFFPCNQILNSDEWEESLQEYAPDQFIVYMQFRKQVLNAFRNYQVPIIALNKSTTKEAVCLVFEKVNTGGVPLSIFELMTASFAAENYYLRDDWFGNEQRCKAGRLARLKQEPLLEDIEPSEFLQAVTLLCTHEKRQADFAKGKIGKLASAVSAKRVAILSLELDQYLKWADQVEKGFLLATRFLRKECFYFAKDLPYKSQIVPLAAVLVKLGDQWLEPKIYEKLTQWFWCGVLGELYGGSVESRIANDLEELLKWINAEGDVPRTVYEAAFQQNRLVTLRTRLSAAYKGVHALLLKNEAKDFFWKASIQELNIEETNLDIHHIFPRSWCEKEGIKPGEYNSIVNKTPISYKANRTIGGKAPSDYLQAIQRQKQVGLNEQQMDEILESHFISPEAIRADNFKHFFEKRKQALLNLIEKAMSKTISRDIEQETLLSEEVELALCPMDSRA